MSGAVVHRDPRDCIAVVASRAPLRCRYMSQAIAADAAGRSVARYIAVRLDTRLSTGRWVAIAPTRDRQRCPQRTSAVAYPQAPDNVLATSAPTRAIRLRSRLVHKAGFDKAIRVVPARRIRTSCRRERLLRGDFPSAHLCRGARTLRSIELVHRPRKCTAQVSVATSGRVQSYPQTAHRRPEPPRTATAATKKRRRAEAPHAYPHAFANDATRNRHGAIAEPRPARIAQRAPAITAR